MPGLNILITENKPAPPLYGKWLSDSLFVSYDLPYAHYPISEWENNEFIFFTEGYFFEWPAFQPHIERFAADHYSGKPKLQVLNAYFKDLSAEFVLLIHQKSTGKTLVVTDVLGRLPLYYSRRRGQAIISRNIAFFEKTAGAGLQLNKQAALETLSLGFALGSKTLYKDVDRIPGGSFIEIEGPEVKIGQYHSFNYQSMINETIKITEAVEVGRSIFVEALKNRSRYGDLNITPITGGLDSRAVAGGMQKAGLPYEFISFSYSQGSSAGEMTIAAQIAEKHKKPLEVVNLEKPQRQYYNSFFYKKYGLSSWDMTFIAPYLENLKNRSAQPIMFTGDGGDKVFPDLSPGLWVNSLKSLIRYSMQANSRLAGSIAVDIFGVSQNYIPEEIEKLLLSYPEQNLSSKYVRFTMENRVNNWLLEGEDRNRCYLTSFTPFYENKFFRLLMSVPNKFKKDFAFYYRFLKEITPETADLTNSNWGFGLNSRRKIQKAYFIQDVKNTRPGFLLKSLLQKNDNYLSRMDETEQTLYKELRAHPKVKQYFNFDPIEKAKLFDEDNLLYFMTFMKIATLEKGDSV